MVNAVPGPCGRLGGPRGAGMNRNCSREPGAGPDQAAPVVPRQARAPLGNNAGSVLRYFVNFVTVTKVFWSPRRV
jgi:hypothetical protein